MSIEILSVADTAIFTHNLSTSSRRSGILRETKRASGERKNGLRAAQKNTIV